MATCFLHFPSPIVQFYSTSQKDQQGHLRILSNTYRKNSPLLSSRNINQASKHPSFSIGPNCSTRPCFPRFASNLIHQSHSICPTNVAANGKALGPVMNRNQKREHFFFLLLLLSLLLLLFFLGSSLESLFYLEWFNTQGLEICLWIWPRLECEDTKTYLYCTRNPRTVQHI